jgi:hypothetical protein
MDSIIGNERNTNVSLIAAVLALGARVSYDRARSAAGTRTGWSDGSPFSGNANGFQFQGKTQGVDPQSKTGALNFNGWARGSRFHGEVTRGLHFKCWVSELQFSGVIEGLQFSDWNNGVLFSGLVNGEVFSGWFNGMTLEGLGIGSSPCAAMRSDSGVDLAIAS